MNRYLLATPLLLVAITALDSAAVAVHVPWGQALAGVCTLAFWALELRHAGRRLRALMLLGLVAATAGELIFSVGLGMYRYRLGSVPVYVPPGHTILYAAVFAFVRRPGVRRHARWLGPGLFLVDAAYSLAWYRLRGDAFGLGCFLAFGALWLVHREARLFFAAMYLLVAFLEQWGTYFGCWRWPPLLFGRVAAVSSGNPPSGVALFYVLFDLACLAMYLGTHWASFERWAGRKVEKRRLEAG